MLKVATHPLPVILLLEICALAWYWFRSRARHASSGANALIAAISVLVIVLTVVSMPAVGELLQDSLSVPSSAAEITPEYIVVLSSGSEEGISPDLDQLGSETMERVLFGVHCWKAHPSARIVMTGAGREENPGRETELMAAVAQCRGVPPAAILREPKAVNTREHPLRLRRLPGFTPTTRLAIVTSRWHERRAMSEFRRYFVNVQPQPVPAAQHRSAIYWVPDVRGLLSSTQATQEWVGILWYRILSLSGR